MIQSKDYCETWTLVIANAQKIFLCTYSENQIRDWSILVFLILLVSGGIVNKSPMKIKCFLFIELLPAIRALEFTCSTDAHLLDGAIAGFRRIADLHSFWHPVWSNKNARESAA